MLGWMRWRHGLVDRNLEVSPLPLGLAARHDMVLVYTDGMGYGLAVDEHAPFEHVFVEKDGVPLSNIEGLSFVHAFQGGCIFTVCRPERIVLCIDLVV